MWLNNVLFTKFTTSFMDNYYVIESSQYSVRSLGLNGQLILTSIGLLLICNCFNYRIFMWKTKFINLDIFCSFSFSLLILILTSPTRSFCY